MLGNIDGLVLTYVPGVSVFTFYPILSLGGCKFIWVVALTVLAAMYCFSVCSWFFHYIVGVRCTALIILLIGATLHIAIQLQ